MASNGRDEIIRAVEASMKDRKMNNADLAKEANVDPGTVGDFLSGKRWPRRKSLGAIIGALDWDAGKFETIMSGGDPANPRTVESWSAILQLSDDLERGRRFHVSDEDRDERQRSFEDEVSQTNDAVASLTQLSTYRSLRGDYDGADRVLAFANHLLADVKALREEHLARLSRRLRYLQSDQAERDKTTVAEAMITEGGSVDMPYAARPGEVEPLPADASGQEDAEEGSQDTGSDDPA